MLSHLSSPARTPDRIAVVGANGFVGRALSAAFAASGAKVIPIGRPAVDLLDPASMATLAALWGPGDAVIITAALTPDKGRDAAAFFKNIRMAEHLVAALAVRPCSHLVYFSSDAVYEGKEPVVSDLTPAAPADLYGAMHLARELLFRDAASRAGIPYCVLRPCAIYGAGDTHNSYGPNRFIRSALAEGRIRIFGAGEETRDHVHIDDVCSVTQLVLGHRSTGTLNLVSGQAVTFGWLASEVARLAGRPVTIEELPRGGPVTHRSFDPRSVVASFPGHQAILPSAGLPLTVAALQGGGAR